jgi:hypothetical protein
MGRNYHRPSFRERAMLIECQSADPAVHALCVRIAKRCVWVIQAVLREDERHLAVNEFYRVCREELDKKPMREREVCSCRKAKRLGA